MYASTELISPSSPSTTMRNCHNNNGQRDNSSQNDNSDRTTTAIGTTTTIRIPRLQRNERMLTRVAIPRGLDHRCPGREVGGRGGGGRSRAALEDLPRGRYWGLPRGWMVATWTAHLQCGRGSLNQ